MEGRSPAPPCGTTDTSSWTKLCEHLAQCILKSMEQISWNIFSKCLCKCSRKFVPLISMCNVSHSFVQEEVSVVPQGVTPFHPIECTGGATEV